MCFANKERLLTKMSRSKNRAQPEICGDCGSSDPSWASINRGILLCAECCSIHRSLGRHISQVKSLRQGSWSPSILNFVHLLNAHGANTVWEHCLLDGNAPKNLRRKPTPKDALHPTKADFIRAKHVNLQFVLKPNVQQLEDCGANLEIELSKQLHASVRSSNLETSLRLLVQGADPSFFHTEKGSTPLHVAAKSGQSLQIELLIVYGADILSKDGQGLTAREIAKANKHHAIAERLVEAMYEVTDRLCCFLGAKKPDHTAGKHLSIPEQNQSEISEQLKIARGKLQLVPNKMFEELVMDLYDEVDRREMEAIWTTSALNPEIGGVPFLPTNPYLSATRNQGRQKLARFSPVEFSGLITDVLIDARRRQNMATLRPIDSPTIPTISTLKQPPINRISNLSDDEPLYDAVASDDDYAALTPTAQQDVTTKAASNSNLPTDIEVENLRKKLEESFSEIDELKTLVKKLSHENTELKSLIEPTDIDVQLRIDLPNSDVDDIESLQLDRINFIKRPVSMYEPREGLQNYNQRYQQIPESRTTASMYQMGSGKRDPTIPSADDVKPKTDLLTKRIQELWVTVQEMTNKAAFVSCSERIREAVDELTSIFPDTSTDSQIRNLLKELQQNTIQMESECKGLQMALLNDDTSSANMYMQDVRNCAYNLAFATKMLVTQF